MINAHISGRIQRANEAWDRKFKHMLSNDFGSAVRLSYKEGQIVITELNARTAQENLKTAVTALREIVPDAMPENCAIDTFHCF